MNTKILVAFVTSMGSTKEVAETVAETLRAKGFAVDLQLLKDVQSLDGYGGVVVGAPLYMFHWHKDALQFLSRHRAALSGGLPIAIFAGGPIGAGDEKEWEGVRKQMDQELAKYPWLKPVSVQLIGGKFDPALLRFPYNILPAMKNLPAADLRDWTAIRAWAGSLAEKFRPAGA